MMCDRIDFVIQLITVHYYSNYYYNISIGYVMP